LCVLSNNSPKEFGIFEAKENASDHIVEILNILEEFLREFEVKTKIQGNLTTIMFQERSSYIQYEFLRKISLEIYTEPQSYTMNLYHQRKGSRNQKQIYKLKVKGNYSIKKLRKNFEKLLKGKNLVHQPKFYPF